MDLLVLLAACPGQVLSRERITEALWPEVVVGDDSLARTVSKLRQALGDDARQPRYVETLSKRGYRLVARVASIAPLDPIEPAAPAGPDRTQAHAGGSAAQAVAAAAPGSHGPVRLTRQRAPALAAVLLAAALLSGLGWWARSADRPGTERAAAGAATLVDIADDHYFQFARGDNEAAIDLYERALERQPDDPDALSGLANALAQRSIRWPALPGEAPATFTRLEDALAHGHLARDPARQQLQRAQRLAERAVAVAPDSPAAHKAAGFVAGAQRRFPQALASYRRAVALDPQAWGALINTGDVLQIIGRRAQALPVFEQAYAAMERDYAAHPAQVRPWLAELGTLVADRHREAGDARAAEAWYRRVLASSPLHPQATVGLAALLQAGGDGAGARRLCAELRQRRGGADACARAGLSATAP